MNRDKKGSPNHQHSCEVCEIESMSDVEYALHAFTKKHCDNVIRLAKNKPILKKQKTKNKTSEVEKEKSKVNTVTHTGSFAKYGYFVPGETYAASKDPKEFNSDYNPYLQKFAESPYTEKSMPVVVENYQQQFTTHLPSAVDVQRKKKKKKKNIKICQICNVTLLTTPSFEAHMKSPQHILKLKICGMGVSAHFVKASSDLHTTEAKEDQKISQEPILISDKPSSQNPTSHSLERCSAGELPQSSSDNVAGQFHSSCFEKEMKEKEIFGNSSEKLFCYTCNILLNTVFQYNEHKHGKRHKINCRALIRKGMTVPPEERVPGIGLLNSESGQPVYPKLYMKMILERQKKLGTSTKGPDTVSSSTISIPESSTRIQSCGHN